MGATVRAGGTVGTVPSPESLVRCQAGAPKKRQTFLYERDKHKAHTNHTHALGRGPGSRLCRVEGCAWAVGAFAERPQLLRQRGSENRQLYIRSCFPYSDLAKFLHFPKKSLGGAAGYHP